MSNRLRGMIPAYKDGRLDEFINCRFGDRAGYIEYVIKHSWLTWKDKMPYFKGIPIIQTDFLVEELTKGTSLAMARVFDLVDEVESDIEDK